MKDTYTPESGTLDLRLKPYDLDLFEKCDDAQFHIGQSYADEPARTIRCVKCGGIIFNVCSDAYFAGIRCVRSRWEARVHDG